MPDGSTVQRYGALAQMLHWGTVLLVGALVGIAITMDDLPLGPEKFKLYNLHKSIGLTVLAVTLLRLIWRRISPPPPLPAAMPEWERRAAKASHFLLYAILLTQPLTIHQAIFEVVSAIGTVGLSIGGTGALDDVGKFLIMATMFAGRLGPLTLFLFLTSRAIDRPSGHPEEPVVVG